MSDLTVLADDDRRWLRPVITISFVLAVHGIIGLIPIERSMPIDKTKEADAPIYLDQSPLSKNEDLPVVHSSQLQDEEEKAKDDKARFGAEFRNRTEKEMKAPFTGRFQQGGSLMVPDETSPDGEMRGPLSMSDLLPFSASPNGLPDDIATGDETVLNTDRVMYAGFINRIADVIYDPWVKFAHEALEGESLSHKLDSKTYITKLNITLNKHGEVLAIQTVKSCGVESLDQAPKKAFWNVEPFPNPPEQMFVKNDVVHVAYEFHFELKSSGFNILPLRI